MSSPQVRTYILPTGFGYAFGAVAIILFFLAVGYANNLIYIFLFFLISVALTGMIITNRNTDGVEIGKIEPKSSFAEEPASVLVSLKNRRTSKLWELELFFQRNPEMAFKEVLNESIEEYIEVPFSSKKRGEIQLPRLILQSRFPVGLFRAWKAYKKTPLILIYPARRGDPRFPLSSSAPEGIQNLGLFRDHRIYQSSDPVRRIDWRASARRQDLLVKNFEEGEKPSLKFHWEQTASLENFEARLSQLALWIDEAEKHGHEYSLEFGTFKTAFSKGPGQHKNCLEILARAKEGVV
ncbi:hypothetical protein AZI86_06465 [Bdellovibrio bacteriovorus]|uniref:DUF58 domain-containing protein n=1 Tax=Bdellovibrio bacteriovorus TaxID=959 RepID=A0A150WSM8_BDEBC|nr:hypothetical protein AZI86_06465 [Bdellovibrio bacteriovorus]